MRARSTGWYADPAQVGRVRYWTGSAWTDVVSWGGSTTRDPTPLSEVERCVAQADAAIVAEYLADAARRGVIATDVVDAVRRDVERGRPDKTASIPWPAPRSTTATPARPAASPRPISFAPHSERPAVATGGFRKVDEPKDTYPLKPGRVTRWWGEARHVIRSDLALHGLAYLGVLLLFVGVTGLIVFSFGDVAPWVRTLTEVFVPGALFLSAWYLRRRGAVIVGTSLAMLGGIVTPIIVAASLTDGAPVPPDPTGRALPIIQGVLVASVAVAMALVARREPSSPLRFLVAPVAWMAAGLTAGVLRDPVPTGYDAARPESIQLAIVLAALTTTVLLLRWRRGPGAITDATLSVALPVAGVTYVLELVLAGGEGWPVASTLVAGVAMLLLLELLHQQLPTEATSILQFVVIAATAARLSAAATPGWVAVGAAIALLAFLEYVGRHRPTAAAIVVGLVLSGYAFLATLGEPWPAAVAFGVLTMWGLWRHVVPADWLPVHDDVGAVPAFAAAVTTGALWMVSDLGPALVVTSALVLLLALAGRLWRRIWHDVLWRWFVPAAALAVSALSATLPWRDASIEVAVATILCAVALLSSGAPVVVRVWPAAAIVVWSFANLGAALDVSRNVQAIALAVMAMTVTIGSIVAATRAHAGPGVWGHLAAIGHVTGLIALAVPTWPGWAAAGVVAAATLGWWTTTVANENAAGSGRPADHLLRGRSVDEVAPLMSLAGTWATVLLAVDAAGWVAFDDPWLAAVSSAFVLVAAAAVRLVHWRRSRRRVLEWATLVAAVLSAAVSIAAVGSDPDQWSPVVSLALGIAVVGVTAAPRPLMFIWSAWVGSAMLTVFFLDRLGAARDWADIVLAGWGAAVLLGGLALNRARHGPVPPGEFLSDRLLLPPTVLGAIAFSVGGSLGLAEGSEAAIGWTAAALSIVVLVVALLIPLGAFLALAEVLATTAYVVIAPWNPLERPWTLAPWALILLLAALATRRSGPWSFARWDLPSFLAAHGVAYVALIAAVGSDSVTATYSSFGAVSIAVGLMLRRPAWVAAGAVLALIASADAGYGWFALVMLLEGLGLTLAGVKQRDTTRWVLLGLGTASLTTAWFALAAWQSWDLSTVVYITVPAAAAIALVAAVCLRAALAPRELCLVWMAAGPSVAAGVTWIGSGEIARRPGGLILAGSLLLLAAAAGVSAIKLGAGMRWIAGALAAAAWAPAAWATEPSELTATLVGTTVALAGTAAALMVYGLRPAAVWVPPASFYVTMTQAGAALTSLAALPDVDPLVVVLVAVSAEIVAFGVLTGWRELHVLAPVVACGAWLVFATDALEGDASWFVMPIGLTVLVVSALVRWIRRGRGGNVTGYDVIALEFVGMTALVASTLARTLAGQLWHGVLAIGIGVLIAGWGILTHVRWRAAFGAGSVVLATILLVAVPLSGAVTWRGPALWITLSVVGVAAITIASVLERNLERMQQVARRFDQMTTGWERVPLHRTDRNGTGPTATMGETSNSNGQPAH